MNLFKFGEALHERGYETEPGGRLAVRAGQNNGCFTAETSRQ